ncbi:DUF6801 domain-containing protein [Nocardioides campestrisoli]|uniref:DUF6801 domain-containing protein n=1 Tax=Nocardioides campestrisoli TaxID=2736757 RepID=UPI0015E7035C|nr:DUF6801 domain-containing protein [Nocardioides campestrisoli]
MHQSVIRRTLAAGASAAVAVTGMAAFTAPATAATSGPVPFTCQVPVLGERSFTLVADTNLPEKVEKGKAVAVSFTATVTAPDNVRGGATLFGTSVEGTAKVVAKAGTQNLPVTANVALTTIPTTPNTELVLPVSGSTTWTPTTLGTQQITLPSFEATLSFPQAGGAPRELGPITCAAAAGASTVVDTVEVVESATTPPTTPPPATPGVAQATKTTSTVKYKKKAKKAVVKVAVANADGTAAAGKVKVVMKKGKKKATSTVTLNAKGKGKAAFKKIAPGKYKLTVKYTGSDASKKSQKKSNVKIK